MNEGEVTNRGESFLSAVTLRLSDVKPQRVRWLWPYRIPRGRLTLIVGDPGLGKSLTTIDIAARLSRGKAWPDGATPSARASTLILSVEDNTADAIRPRAEYAGADLSRLHVLKAVKENDNERGVNIVDDLPVLRSELERIGDVALVIVDPLSAYLPRRSGDTFKDSDVRNMLMPLVMLAEELDLAIVGVMHLNKSVIQAIYRVSGSVAFTALARAVFAVTSNPEDPERQQRLFVPVKASNAPLGSTLAFTCESSENRENVRVAWGEPVNITADDVFSPQARPTETPSGGRAQKEAIDFLRATLADGPKPFDEILEEAKIIGISSPTLKRARRTLNVEAFKENEKLNGRWFLRMPRSAGPTALTLVPSGSPKPGRKRKFQR